MSTCFRYLSLILLSVLPVFSVLAREVYFVDGSKGNSFAYTPGTTYHELGFWQKIAYMLAKYDVTIRCLETINIQNQTTEELHRIYGKDRQLLFLDYRGIYPEIQDMEKMPKEALMTVLFEPPAVFSESYSSNCLNLFSKIFTFHDGLVDGKKFIKFRYYVYNSMKENLPSFQDRKLCCSIVANKRSDYSGELYTERRRAILFFERQHPEDFDLYGPGWENSGFSTYQGVIDSKCEIMKNYKFAIVYENTRDVPGYITEKIFDSFQAGVIPIYLGSPTIEQEIPPECFIDFRKFSSYNQLYNYLSSMKEEEFNDYLGNIRKFLASDRAKLFDYDHFILSLVNGILGTELTINDLK